MENKKKLESKKGHYELINDPSDLRLIEGQDGTSSGTHELKYEKVKVPPTTRISSKEEQAQTRPQQNTEIKQSEGENNESSSGEDENGYTAVKVEYQEIANTNEGSSVGQVHLDLKSQDRNEIKHLNFQDRLKQIMTEDKQEDFKAKDSLKYKIPS